VIPYGRQSIDDDDIAAVVDVLKGDWLTQGPHVERFEQTLTETVEVRHAIAFSSGTAALHAAAGAAGLGPGDLLLTSPLSFAASASCARYVGASPGFVDIDPATLNIDTSSIPPGAAALVPVHYAGLPVDLSSIANRPPVVIEDAAHAIGARTPDGPVGNCARSEMTMFSFHPVKTVTTGEGGAVTTNSDELADRLRLFRNHGMVRKPEEGLWYYEIQSLGFNYRMTDMQAALGITQLGKLERFIARRTELADRYRELLADLPIELPPAPPPGWRHGYHLFPVRVENRDTVFAQLRAAGIGVQVHFIPIYRHPLYADLAIERSDFPNAEAAYERLISLPLFPDLTEEEQNEVVARLEFAL
jgi:perosamine synthetase